LNKNLAAHIALLLTNLFFAINLSAVKFLTNNALAQPFGINVIRVGVSVILFWALFLLKPVNVRIERKDTGRFLACALTGIAINQLLFLKGLSLTYSIHAALLMLIVPILIVVGAAIVLKERISLLRVTGLALGVAGAIVLISARDSAGNAGNVIWGDVLIVINAISYTIFFILVKPLMIKYNPIVVTRWIFTFGLFMVLPFGWTEFTNIRWQSFGVTGYTSIVLIVFFGTFLAYLFNVYGIKILGAATAGSYIYTQPFFAAAIAMIFLKEPLQPYKIVAAGLIFSGVYLANKKVKHD